MLVHVWIAKQKDCVGRKEAIEYISENFDLGTNSRTHKVPCISAKYVPYVSEETIVVLRYISLPIKRCFIHERAEYRNKEKKNYSHRHSNHQKSCKRKKEKDGGKLWRHDVLRTWIIDRFQFSCYDLDIQGQTSLQSKR